MIFWWFLSIFLWVFHELADFLLPGSGSGRPKWHRSTSLIVVGEPAERVEGRGDGGNQEGCQAQGGVRYARHHRWESSGTVWPVKHGRVFLVLCKKWLVPSTVAYTGQVTFYKVLEKRGHAYLVGLYKESLTYNRVVYPPPPYHKTPCRMIFPLPFPIY